MVEAMYQLPWESTVYRNRHGRGTRTPMFGTRLPRYRTFPAEHGIPPRVVLYRMPLQSHARSRMDLQFAIRDEVVLRLAELYGRRPEEIDPDWGM